MLHLLLSRRALSGPFGIALLLLIAAPSYAGGLAPDLLRQVAADPASTRGHRVIVRFTRSGVTPSAVALAYSGQAHGGLRLIDGAVLTIPQPNLEKLAADSAIRSVSPDRALAGLGDFDTVTVGANTVWSSPGYHGSGVGVAVLDTGVAPAAADWQPGGGGASRLRAWKDFVGGQLDPYDDNGHGTHVAGIVLGSGNSSAGSWTGTAPAAQLIAVKVLDSQGAGLSSTVIQGIDWCVENRVLHNIRVINLSLGQRPGESTTTDPLCSAVRRAVDAGITVVVSAGNKGKNSAGQIVYGGVGCPGNEPAALTVGALNTKDTASRADDRVCDFSSRGPTYLDHWAKPDLVAPGNHIVSVRSPGSIVDGLHPENRVDWDPSTGGVDYYRLSGSSMAAGQVAGIVALMLEANPNLQPNTVKGILQYTAERLTVTSANGVPLTEGLSTLTQGAGSANAVGAIEVAGKLDHAIGVGSWWRTAALTGQSTIDSRLFSWGARIFWGSQYYSGDDLFGYRQRAWSMEHRWGAETTWIVSLLSGDNGVTQDEPFWQGSVIWSDSLIWGDQYTWGEDEAHYLGESTGLLDG
jgi:serine protease AprX